MTYFRNLFVQSCVSVLQVSADLDLRLDLRFQAVCSASISIHVLERTLILLWDKIMGTYLLLWLYVLPSMTDLMKSWAQLIIICVGVSSWGDEWRDIPDLSPWSDSVTPCCLYTLSPGVPSLPLILSYETVWSHSIQIQAEISYFHTLPKNIDTKNFNTISPWAFWVEMKIQLWD